MGLECAEKFYNRTSTDKIKLESYIKVFYCPHNKIIFLEFQVNRINISFFA